MRENLLFSSSTLVKGSLNLILETKIEMLQFEMVQIVCSSSSIWSCHKGFKETPVVNTAKAESDEVDSKEVTLPNVNLIFDGFELHPDICACLQARRPVSLIAERLCQPQFLLQWNKTLYALILFDGVSWRMYLYTTNESETLDLSYALLWLFSVHVVSELR